MGLTKYVRAPSLGVSGLVNIHGGAACVRPREGRVRCNHHSVIVSSRARINGVATIWKKLFRSPASACSVRTERKHEPRTVPEIETIEKDRLVHLELYTIRDARYRTAEGDGQMNGIDGRKRGGRSSCVTTSWNESMLPYPEGL